MAIAHDAQTVATAYTSTGTQTTSHAAGASASAAVVLIDQNASTGDQVSGVTYDGVAMTRVASQTEATEAGRVYVYWITGIPGGTKNVAMTTTGSADKQLVVATMTVGAGKTASVAGTGTGTSAGSSNPAWNTVTAASLATVLYEVIHSGLDTMTNTPAASWTLISSTDLGTQGRGFARRTGAGGTITSGWTAATSDDWVGSSIAFQEADPISALVDDFSTDDTATWTDTSAASVVSGGVDTISITANGQYEGRFTDVMRELAASLIRVQVVSISSQTNTETTLRLTRDTGTDADEIGLYISASNIRGYYRIASSQTDGSNVAWPGNGTWIEVAEAAGTISMRMASDYAMTSPTSIYSVASATGAPQGTLRFVSLVTGRFAAGSHTAVWDNVNTSGAVNATATPSVVAGTTSIPSPTVATGETVTATAVAGTTSVSAPTVTTGASVAPAVVAGATTVGAAVVATGSRVTAVVVAGATTIPVPVVRQDRTVTAAVVAGSATVPAATVSTGSTVAGTVVAGSASIPTPTASGGATATPPVVAGSTTVPGPAISTGETVPATVVAGATSIPTPAVSASSVPQPPVVAGTATVPAAAVATGETVTAVVVAGVTAIPTPTVTAGGNATVNAAVVAGSTSIPTPVVRQDRTVTAVVVAAAVTIPSVTVGTGSAVSAAVVACTTAVPAVTVQTGATAAPVTVAAAVTIPLPGLPHGASVTVAVVACTATIPPPQIGALFTVGVLSVSAAVNVLAAASTAAGLATDDDSARLTTASVAGGPR